MLVCVLNVEEYGFFWFLYVDVEVVDDWVVWLCIVFCDECCVVFGWYCVEYGVDCVCGGFVVEVYVGECMGEDVVYYYGYVDVWCFVGGDVVWFYCLDNEVLLWVGVCVDLCEVCEVGCCDVVV